MQKEVVLVTRSQTVSKTQRNGFMSAQAPDIGEGIIPAYRQAGVCETDAGAGAAQSDVVSLVRALVK